MKIQGLNNEQQKKNIVQSPKLNQFLKFQRVKKQFLENMSLAFDKSAVLKEYKDEIEILQQDKD